jgi:hypothetical protein
MRDRSSMEVRGRERTSGQSKGASSGESMGVRGLGKAAERMK